MQSKGLLLKGRCSIVNSHGEQVHVNESFVMWFNTITLKEFIAPFCFCFNTNTCRPRWSRSNVLASRYKVRGFKPA